MKKRILFDGTCISSLNSGVGNYAMSLLQSLQSYQAEAEFHVLVRPGIQTRGSHLNAKVIGRNENRLRKLAPWDFCGLGRQFSLLHEPNYVPQRFAGPVVVTIHDLTTFMFPRFHPVLRVCWARSFRQVPTAGCPGRPTSISWHLLKTGVRRCGFAKGWKRSGPNPRCDSGEDRLNCTMPRRLN